MADLDKVIKGVESCVKMGRLGVENCRELECPYFENGLRLSCWIDVLTDALELLKSQQAKMDAMTLFKRLDTRGHFRDFWHRASSRRNDKKISTRRERRLLKREAPYWIVDYEHQDFTCTACRCHSEKAYLYCPWCGSEMDWKDGQ